MKKISNYYIVSKDEVLKRFSDEPNPIEHFEKVLTIVPKSFGKEKSLPMITFKKEGDLYYVPYRWGIDTFGDAIEDVSNGYSIDVKLKDGVSPRKEQVEPFNQCKYHLENTNRFLLEAMPGWGKSVNSIMLIAELKVSTVIVVGKGALINQWRQEIKKFTNLTDDDIGLVKGDSFIF